MVNDLIRFDIPHTTDIFVKYLASRLSHEMIGEILIECSVLSLDVSNSMPDIIENEMTEEIRRLFSLGYGGVEIQFIVMKALYDAANIMFDEVY